MSATLQDKNCILMSALPHRELQFKACANIQCIALLIAPVHFRLASDDVQPPDAAAVFTSLLRDHLESHDQLPRTRRKTGQEKWVGMVPRTKKIERIVKHQKSTKNSLRKYRKENPKAFLDVCRLYNKCFNSKKKLNHDVCREEKAFRTNPWHFSKKVCNGKTNQQQPEFDASQALAHLQTTFTGDRHTLGRVGDAGSTSGRSDPH